MVCGCRWDVSNASQRTLMPTISQRNINKSMWAHKSKRSARVRHVRCDAMWCDLRELLFMGEWVSVCLWVVRDKKKYKKESRNRCYPMSCVWLFVSLCGLVCINKEIKLPAECDLRVHAINTYVQYTVHTSTSIHRGTTETATTTMAK